MKVLIAVLAMALAAGIVVQSMRVSKLKAQNEAQRQQVAALQAQADHLSSPASPPAPAATDEDRSELLRLRNQAAQLKQVTNELQRLRMQVQQLQAANQHIRATPATPAPDTNAAAATGPVPRESWAFAGYATPEATLQSAVFAMSQGDYQTFLASMSPEEAARMQKSFEGKTPEQIAEEGRRETANARSFQILAKQELAPDRVVLNVFVAGEDRAQRIMMQKIGEEWKWAGNASRRQQQQPQAPAVPQ
jgi:hypothetical protein